MARFAEKIAVLTGAASGLGREVVLAMAGEGAAGLLLLDRNAEGLAAVAADAGARGKTRIETLALDVADSRAMAEAAARARAAFGGIDILVCAAGILGPTLPVVDYPEEEWDRVFAVNVRGTYLAARHFVPLIRARGGGAIVNFASTAGLVGSPILGAYGASKGAVVLMTRGMAHAHAAEKIRVNCVCPGSIETPMLRETFAGAGDAAAQRAREELYRLKHPLGRFGKPGEVAAAVLFLASDEASFLTGVALPIDGGRIA
jgi:NAD(P)-dependent dehydrogenase (short-subunit alcohol dehydrogenase family)